MVSCRIRREQRFLSAVVQGEIRLVKPWSVQGHEPDGEHPVLVMGRGASDDGNDILVVPTMSPDKAHENDWEVELYGANSCALVDGLRTVKVSDLGKPRSGMALPEDLDQVRFVLRWILRDTEAMMQDRFTPGSVYNVIEPNRFAGSDKFLVLHYNHRNDMAMVMQVAPSKPGADRLAVPILSCPTLVGTSFLPAYVWPVSASHRLGTAWGTISRSELQRAIDRLMEVVGPPALPTAG